MPRSTSAPRPPLPVVAAAALGLGLGLACAPRAASPTRSPADAIPRAKVPASVGAKPGILSAQHRAPTLADLDDRETIAAVVYAVLSVEVDPTTLDPNYFLVALDDGRRRRPTEVRLTAASERDENRTLILGVARPEGAERVRPLAVTITGPVFGEGGEPLEGLAAEVDGLEAPPRLVQALRVREGAGACAGGQAIHTFWSVPIAGGEAIDLAAVTITLRDGSVTQPAASDDHRLGPGALQGDDNVVDFCVGQSSPATRISVSGDLLRDHFGNASAAGESVILGAPRS
ncbi:MAG: hypothetical protein R3A79_21785 [Nannocystaceae bacterium]